MNLWQKIAVLCFVIIIVSFMPLVWWAQKNAWIPVEKMEAPPADLLLITLMIDIPLAFIIVLLKGFGKI